MVADQDRAMVVRHRRYIVFQIAELAARPLFAKILRCIDRLRGPTLPAT